MPTYWYESESHILLFLAPQAPPPGRYLGSVKLTLSELELLEQMVEEEKGSRMQVVTPG
jgi:hypothetical protein